MGQAFRNGGNIRKQTNKITKIHLKMLVTLNLLKFTYTNWNVLYLPYLAKQTSFDEQTTITIATEMIGRVERGRFS